MQLGLLLQSQFCPALPALYSPYPPPLCAGKLSSLHTYTHQLAYILVSPLAFIDFSDCLCLVHSHSDSPVHLCLFSH